MKTITTVILMTFSILCQAQMGEPFPIMKTETLANQFLDLPGDLNGKYSLICLASSKKAEEYLDGWYNPIYNNFIREKDPNNLFDFTYDIHVYFIPMVTGVKKVGYKKVMKESKKSVDERLSPHILFFEGSLKDYKHKLGLDDKNVPYFFVLDPDGKVINTAEGRYTSQKMQEVVNDVRSAIKHE